MQFIPNLFSLAGDRVQEGRALEQIVTWQLLCGIYCSDGRLTFSSLGYRGFVMKVKLQVYWLQSLVAHNLRNRSFTLAFVLLAVLKA